MYEGSMRARAMRVAMRRISWTDQRDMAMPAMPGAGFVVIEAEFVLGGLEAVLDRPAMPFHLHQRLDGCVEWTPGREEGEITVGDIAADQQPARPDARERRIKITSIEIGQFEIGPIVQSCAFGPVARRQASPALFGQGLGDVLGRSGDGQRFIPRAKGMIGALTPRT